VHLPVHEICARRYSIFSHTRAVVERDLLSDAERDFAKLEVKENIQLCSIKHVACLLFSTKVSFFEKVRLKPSVFQLMLAASQKQPFLFKI
jgi:hypothetical protein